MTVKQRTVDLIWALGERVAEQQAAGGVVRGLQSAQKLVEGLKHLDSELLTNLVLEPTTGIE